MKIYQEKRVKIHNILQNIKIEVELEKKKYKVYYLDGVEKEEKNSR